jgi:uncharacterized protein (DUF983 family)
MMALGGFLFVIAGVAGFIVADAAVSADDVWGRPAWVGVATWGSLVTIILGLAMILAWFFAGFGGGG